MSVPPDISLGVIFRSVWNGLMETFGRLRLLCLLGLLIYLIVGTLEFMAPADNAVIKEALDASKTILILPIEVAIYRLLILGEASP